MKPYKSLTKGKKEKENISVTQDVCSNNIDYNLDKGF